MNETRTDSKSLMVKFNEQLQPLFGLLREVEDIKLAPCILEPEPVDIKALRLVTIFLYFVWKMSSTLEKERENSL